MQIELPDIQQVFTIELFWNEGRLLMNDIVIYSKEYDGERTNIWEREEDFYNTVADKFRRLLED